MKHDSDRLHTKSCKDIEPHLSCTAGSAKTWQFPVLDFQYSGGCQLGIKAAEDTLNSYELLQECRISGQMFMKGFFKPYNLILNRPTLERSIQKDVLRVVAVSKTNPGMDELATALESCDCLTWRRVSTISSDGEATEHKVNLQSSCQTVPLVA